MTPAWTVGIVNHKSAVFIGWQLKTLFEANPPQSFRVVIVDNSRPHERAELERLTAPYAARHGNVDLVFHEPKPGPASMQHGEGLELVRSRIDTPYLLVQDPDFFWLRRGHLALLAGLLERNVVVGAPYPAKVGMGDPWFPAAYGAAYRSESIRSLGFDARVSPESIAESFARWPPSEGYGFTFDVGWRIREALSEMPHLAFPQRLPENLGMRFGQHSFQWVAREYVHDGRPVAIHLFRGSFTGTWTAEFADPGQEVPRAWQKARDRLGAHFHARAQRDGRPPPGIRQFLANISRSLRRVARGGIQDA